MTPLDVMLVHSKVNAVTHLHTWVERRAVKIKCFAQKHNTVSPATVRIRGESTNHEAIAPPSKIGSALFTVACGCACVVSYGFNRLNFCNAAFSDAMFS